MPSQTKFANLSLYNNTTDSMLKYGEFRASVAGIDTTSNMNKIDKILEKNDNDIKSLQAKDLSIDENIDSINTEITLLKQKDSEHDEKILSLEGRVSANESGISENKNSIESLNLKTSNIEENITSLEEILRILTESVQTKATTATYTVTISTTWTGENAPYTQSIAVSGIKADDNPLVDILLNDSSEIAIKEQEEYAKVSDIKTTDGQIMVICLEEKPEVEMKIQLKVVR